MKLPWSIPFRPKLVDCLEGYTSQKLMADLTAGLTVGIVALPLAMALGIASGVKPGIGIYTAVVAGFIISAFGGSRVQIGGPTAAFIPIVYGIITGQGMEALLVCTVMAGVILLVMGITRLGDMIKFIPYPVTTGFTSGIAVLIFTTQVKDFLGLKVGPVPAKFFEKMKVLGEAMGSIHWPTVVLAVGSLLLIRLWPRSWARRVPGSIVAVIAGTVAVTLFALPVQTIGSQFPDGIPQELPHFHVPHFSFGHLEVMIWNATTIALLAAIESLLSAVVADGMINDRHDSNQELMAQGLANIACPFFGGIPATGAIARTATNIRSGAVSPIAGMMHAMVLLVIILVAAPLAKFIPLATLSAVLVVVALNMGEWHEFARLKRFPKSDAAVLVTTFVLTVILDLTYAVAIGMMLAAMLFIKRVSETTKITSADESSGSEEERELMAGKNVPPGVLIYRVFGALLFGAAEKLETALKRAGQEPEVLVLHLQHVIAMDSTGLNALESIYERLASRGKQLILCGPHTQPYMMMEKAGFFDHLGHENVVADVDEALARARKILKLPAMEKSGK